MPGKKRNVEKDPRNMLALVKRKCLKATFRKAKARGAAEGKFSGRRKSGRKLKKGG